MLRRVSKYIKMIRIEGGPVWYRLNRETKNFEPNPFCGYTYNILGSTLQPGQSITLTVAGQVVVETIERDEDKFFNLGMFVSTDALHEIVVRGFYTQPVTGLDKKTQIEGFVFADLVF